MRLIEILKKGTGPCVWNFTHEAMLQDFGEAHRRLQSYLVVEKRRNKRITARGAYLVDQKSLVTEPVLIIEMPCKPR